MEKIKSYFNTQLRKDLYFEDIIEENYPVILDAFENNKIIETEDKNIMFYYGLYYITKNDIEKIRFFYDKLITDGNDKAILNLAYYYYIDKKFQLMKNYYLKAIERKNNEAMFSLGSYYAIQDDVENMKKYYFMATKNGNPDALRCIGNYYRSKNMFNEMNLYYLKAISNGDSWAMCELGIYYFNRDKKLMKKYLLMAHEAGNIKGYSMLGTYYYALRKIEKMLVILNYCVEKNDEHAMTTLGKYYEEIEDFENMKKYYFMAINRFDKTALIFIIKYYDEVEKDYSKLKHYLKMFYSNEPIENSTYERHITQVNKIESFLSKDGKCIICNDNGEVKQPCHENDLICEKCLFNSWKNNVLIPCSLCRRKIYNYLQNFLYVHRGNRLLPNPNK